MPLDVERYRQTFEPKDIFDVLPRETIQQMIRGFVFEHKKGISLFYGRYDAEQKRWIVQDDFIDPHVYTKGEDLKYYNKACNRYRDKMGHGQCIASGQKNAQRYLDGNLEDSQYHECWLGLGEIAYPLKIGSDVRAVLITSQIVPNDDAKIAKIKENIRDNAGDELADELTGMLKEEREDQRRDPDYAASRRRSLEGLGRMLQNVLDELYDSKKYTVTRKILQQTNEELAVVSLGATGSWYERAGNFLAPFCELVGLDKIEVFMRDRKNFVHRVPFNERGVLIPVRQVLNAIEPDTLVRAEDDEKARGLALLLAPHAPDMSFILRHSQVEGIRENVQLSSLLVLHGAAKPVYSTLIKDFCRLFARWADFASLGLHLEMIQARYKKTVAEVAHDFRSPLQVIQFDLEEVAALPGVCDDEELKGLIEQSIARTVDAREHSLRLQRAFTREPEKLNLVPLLRKLMWNIEPLAKRHPCELVREGDWPSEILVRGDREQLRRAFRNLLDNAIKFSWQGKTVDGRFHPHTVTVGMKLWPGPAVRVRMSNYGAGVPSHLLEWIREPGRRAGVRDRKTRRGTGWGLPIAIQVLEDHGGWLEMTSTPADDNPRSPGEQYHRYTTVFDAYLPILRHKEE